MSQESPALSSETRVPFPTGAALHHVAWFDPKNDPRLTLLERILVAAQVFLRHFVDVLGRTSIRSQPLDDRSENGHRPKRRLGIDNGDGDPRVPFDVAELDVT